MSSETNGGVLHGVYRDRIGEPTTDDEVWGYWLFLVGVLLGVLGIVAFLPSESAVGTSGITLREVSIVLAAVGLALLVAGFVVRLPLQSWANYAAYLGIVVCLAAAAWFVMVFPADWSVQTGNQPVVILYAAGLAIITIGGVLAPLIVGVTREDLEASQRETEQLRSELEELRAERDDLESQLEAARSESSAGAAERGDLQAELDRLREEREHLQAQLAAAREATEESEAERADLEEESEQIWRDKEELIAELASLRTSQAQFELYEDEGGKYRWRLRHRNGNVIATSGQGYTRKHNAQKGLASVRRNALGGAVLHVEPEEDESPEDALDAAPVIPEAAEESAAEFEIYEDSEDKHRWRLVHENGEILADSGEDYAARRGARNGVESVKTNADAADYLRFDPTSFEIYRDAGGEWRWRLVHENGNVLASASEGYTRRRDAKRSVDSIRESVGDDEAGFEVYEDSSGDHRWRYRAGNDEIVATGGQGYHSKSEATRGVERFRKYAPTADALDVGFAAFEVFRDDAEEWRWRLRHRNGNVLADGGEGYASRSGVHDAVESIKTNAPGAAVTES